MNHHSQNVFHKLKLVYGVFIRDLIRKSLEIHLEHKQPLFSKLLTCSFRQIFPLAGLVKQITMQSAYSWVCKSEGNLSPLQVHCIYEYVKARSTSQSLGLCFDSVKLRSFETKENSSSELSAGLLVVITRWLRNTFDTTEVLFIFFFPFKQGNKIKIRYSDSRLLRKDASKLEGTK